MKLSSPNYADAVAATVTMAEPRVNDAARVVADMRTSCQRLAEFFGEANTTPSEKVFAAMRQFIVSFNASKAKVLRQRQSQARKAAANSAASGAGGGGGGAEAQKRLARRRSAINGEEPESSDGDDDEDISD